MQAKSISPLHDTILRSTLLSRVYSCTLCWWGLGFAVGDETLVLCTTGPAFNQPDWVDVGYVFTMLLYDDSQICGQREKGNAALVIL